MDNQLTTKANQLLEFFASYESDNYSDLSLVQGKIGLLLLSSISSAPTTLLSKADSVVFLEDIFDELARKPVGNSYASGLAGLGWVIEYMVAKEVIDADTNELLEEVDAILYDWMLEEQHRKNYDFLHGSMGVGLYFLSRINSNPLAKEKVSKLLDLLIEAAVVEQDGSTKWEQGWDTFPEHEPVYNLGLAHGIPSILVFLVKSFQKNICREKLYPIIQSTTSYILKQHQAFDLRQFHFPHAIIGKRTYSESRMAWCYGDLGVCCALWQANQVLRDERVADTISDILHNNATRRDPQQCMITDASFCHGSAGAAYIFRRFYDRLGYPELLDASRYWYKKTLELANHPDGYVDYKFWAGDRSEWENRLGLLDGLAGVALSLLYAGNRVDASWDEVLLIS